MEIVILIKLAVRLEQLIAHGVVVGVEHLGPVQRDMGNLAFFLIQNGVVGHVAISSCDVPNRSYPGLLGIIVRPLEGVNSADQRNGVKLRIEPGASTSLLCGVACPELVEGLSTNGNFPLCSPPPRSP